MALEDSLFNIFTTYPHLSHLEFIDDDRLGLLYNRYRKIPASITKATLALLSACFAMASFTLNITSLDPDGRPCVHNPGLSIDRIDLAFYKQSVQALGIEDDPSVEGACKISHHNGAESNRGSDSAGTLFER